MGRPAGYGVGALTYHREALAYDFAGPLFRLIPHGSSEPLDFTYSLRGGRWNPPGSFPVMYAFTDTATARGYMAAQEINGAFSWTEVTPESQLDLLVLEVTVSGLADLATEQGLALYNLPRTYPAGFESRDSWPRTQPIGVAVYGRGSTGIVVRSATSRDFSRPAIRWAELAIFTERAPSPRLVERFGFDEWYRG